MSSGPRLRIAAVERETARSKGTLRVSERRYGFPPPRRDASGERLYAPVQVSRLAPSKRLMDRGQRPGKVMTLDVSAFLALGEARSAAEGLAR